jgi:hypothetical protein
MSILNRMTAPRYVRDSYEKLPHRCLEEAAAMQAKLYNRLQELAHERGGKWRTYYDVTVIAGLSWRKLCRGLS